MNELQTRIVTGLSLGFIVLISIWLHQLSALVFFGVIAMASVWEFQGLLAEKIAADAHYFWNNRLVITLLSGLIYLVITLTITFSLPIHYLSLLFLVVVFVFIKALYSTATGPFIRIAINLLSFLYLTIPCALAFLVAWIDSSVYVPERIIGMVFLVWINDSFAYFSGRLFGKTPLFPRVSPKKTWEGSIGGVLSTIGIAYLFSLLMPVLPTYVWVGMGAIVALFGSLGDLVESVLKRSLGVKDSGTILPGHGGILDRFDALFLATPVVFVWLCMTLL